MNIARNHAFELRDRSLYEFNTVLTVERYAQFLRFESDGIESSHLHTMHQSLFLPLKQVFRGLPYNGHPSYAFI